MSYPTYLLPTTVVGSYPQPDWLVDRAGCTRTACRGCMRTTSGAFPNRCWNRRRTMQRSWRSATWSAPASTSSPTAKSAAKATPTASPSRWTASTSRHPAKSRHSSTAPRRAARGRQDPPPRAGRAARRAVPAAPDRSRPTKITLPGPFTLAQQAKNEHYKDEKPTDDGLCRRSQRGTAGLEGGRASTWFSSMNPGCAPILTRRCATAVRRSIAHWRASTVRPSCTSASATPPWCSSRSRPATASCRARRHRRTADLDRGGTTETRPRRAARPVEQADHAGRARSRRTNVETPSSVADRIRAGLKYVAPDRLIPAPDCGMKYLPRDVAFGKLRSLAEGAAIVRRELAG